MKVNSICALRTAVLLGTLLAGSLNAGAAESGFYLGASYGEATHEVDNESPYQAVHAESESAWCIKGGYRFNRYSGFELGYASLGEYELQSVNGDPFFPTPPPVRYVYDGAVVSFFGAVPLGNFELRVKAGLLFARITNDFQLTLVRSPGDAHLADERYETKSAQTLQGGVVLGYTIAKRVFINVDWTRFREVDSGSNPPATTIDTLTFGVDYRF